MLTLLSFILGSLPRLSDTQTVTSLQANAAVQTRLGVAFICSSYSQLLSFIVRTRIKSGLNQVTDRLASAPVY